MPAKTLARFFLLAPLLAAPALSAPEARAQEPKPDLIAQEKDWGAYQVDTTQGRVCYALSKPKDSTPKNVNRDPTYFFVTTRPKENIRHQVSVIIGYPFKEGSDVTVEIGSAKFLLFTKDNKAFIDNTDEQGKLIGAMKAGASMMVRGTSSRGTNTADTYSLAGVTASLGHVDKACP